jgi:hypothetical protein
LFFCTKIEACFEYRRGWYRSGAVAGLVLEYYVLLRSVVRRKPEVRRCLTPCRDCGIFFVADPRNAGRHDLRCPFGCQQAHLRQASTQRSVAYYQDETGRMKKRIQNGKRGTPAAKPAPATGEGPSETLVEHLRMVTSRIEGRRVSREEILALLLRQRSMVEGGKAGDDGRRPDEHPP